jgi:glutathione synthase
MKTLFIADPVASLKPATDTSFALLRECLKRKHPCYWAESPSVRLEDGRVILSATRVESCEENKQPKLSSTLKDFKLREFSVGWIRKDPPFDSSYFSLCWLLSLEEHRLSLLNRPSLLLRFHEKLLPFEAFSRGFLKTSDLVPTHIGDAQSARTYLVRKKISDAVRKPFLGFGGSDVKRFQLQEGTPLPAEKDLELTQPFLPEIASKGDRRVFFLGGKVLGDFVRMPPSGGHVSNIARGGSGKLVPMTPTQKEVSGRVGKFLKSIGVVFAGADMIGNRISEINITSPTGVRTFYGLSGIDLAPRIVDYSERSAL